MPLLKNGKKSRIFLTGVRELVLENFPVRETLVRAGQTHLNVHLYPINLMILGIFSKIFYNILI